MHRARELVEGRRSSWVAVSSRRRTRRVQVLTELGAARCFIVATGVGTGPLPDPADAEWIVVDVEAPDMISEMRVIESIVTDPPDRRRGRARPLRSRSRRARCSWRRSARRRCSVIGPDFGARPASWVALEDKTVCDALFDAAGVPRPPSPGRRRRHSPRCVTRPTRSTAAPARCGRATRVTASTAAGQYVRWVRDGDDGRDAAGFFADHCDRVRVAPFVDGISCSVHGFVTDDGVAVFRPVELVNLRRRDAATGSSTRGARRSGILRPTTASRCATRRAGSATHLRDERRRTEVGSRSTASWAPTASSRPSATRGRVRGSATRCRRCPNFRSTPCSTWPSRARPRGCGPRRWKRHCWRRPTASAGAAGGRRSRSASRRRASRGLSSTTPGSARPPTARRRTPR